MTNEIEDIVAIVDADSIVYQVGYVVASLDEDEKYAHDLLDASIASILDFSHASEIELYIGTSTNYRKELATIQVYKGNRKDSTRPEFYDSIRKRMVKKHRARACHGEEAEDAVGIRANQFYDFDNFVVCNVDKDVDMIPGRHYNYRTKKNYFVTPHQAMRNFYFQLVTGDSTDNIPGLYHLLIEDDELPLAHKFRYSRYKSKLIGDLSQLNTEVEMFDHVMDIYKEYGELDRHKGKRILEVARLLWIRRHILEMWEPPTCRGFNYIDMDRRELPCG